MSSSAIILTAPSLDTCSCEPTLLPPLSCQEHGATIASLEHLKPALANAREGLKRVEAGENAIKITRDFDQHLDAAAASKLCNTWQLAATGRPAAAAALVELKAQRIADGGPDGIKSLACSLISKHGLDDTFYVMDLANVVRLYKAWRAAMPRVTPFYAIKCNGDPGLVQLLASLGAGFDCASMGEITQVLKIGVPTSRIIFAHPCKRPCDIRFAREHGVNLTTFDTESELVKISNFYPGFKCVLRIRADDPEARVPLGLKYGASPDEAAKLLAAAQRLGLDVVGVSFHVGSACKNLAAYTWAIEKAREIFDVGTEMGYNMQLLDIGGGFTGHFDSSGNVMFGDIATTINSALAAHFPPESGVQVIAEPGRYFAETAGTLLTPVYGTRDRPDAAGGIKKDYWITDGLYGSFNCILYDGQNPEYMVLRSPQLPAMTGSTQLYTSTIWGPTCDSADCVYKDVQLPLLRNGDWLCFPNAGAYTVAGACDFNGIAMTQPKIFYVYSEHTSCIVCSVAEQEGCA